MHRWLVFLREKQESTPTPCPSPGKTNTSFPSFPEKSSTREGDARLGQTACLRGWWGSPGAEPECNLL